MLKVIFDWVGRTWNNAQSTRHLSSTLYPPTRARIGCLALIPVPQKTNHFATWIPGTLIFSQNELELSISQMNDLNVKHTITQCVPENWQQPPVRKNWFRISFKSMKWETKSEMNKRFFPRNQNQIKNITNFNHDFSFEKKKNFEWKKSERA